MYSMYIFVLSGDPVCLSERNERIVTFLHAQQIFPLPFSLFPDRSLLPCILITVRLDEMIGAALASWRRQGF